MFDPSSPDQGTLPSDLTVQTSESEEETLFPFPLADFEKPLTPSTPPSPMQRKIRSIFLISPDQKKVPRLPVWLHELVGWGVFFALLAAFLGLQIYLNHLLSPPLNQIALIFTVLVEIVLLWRWDQFWY